ncbi:hypothetical protein RJJ65_32075 [Rhizobium hidalgonense]|uniref:Phage tail lysozyme domain-containing protein n=1 Tax=Rhizobium hidalgonense TaxID=1538159 RepID=A0AAJ2LQR7_9HYPH|nr:hypothetical protein [Rhizobium hidalgonense]MDR9777196.1 hypothetical protein [Rhizobium hidalgonense]
MAILEAVFANKAGQTPQEVERRRKMAQALVEAGSGGKPPSSGLELAGRLAMTLTGQYQAGKADRMDREGQAAGSKALLDALYGSSSGSPSPSGSSNIPMTGAANEVSAGSPNGGNSYRDAIAGIESAGSGDYSAVGPTHPKMGRALGRYQIMESNIGPWSQEALGRTVTPEEFMADPKIQDAIFDKKFGGYVSQYGPEGAAQAWFAGPGGVGKLDRKDSLGTSVGDYTQKFSNALGTGQQVASLDPSAGMPARAPTQGPTQPAPTLPPPTTVAIAPPVAAQPQTQVAQALTAPPPPSAPPGYSRETIARLLANPYTAEQGQQLLMLETKRRQDMQAAQYEQQLKMSDPKYQQDLQKGNIELENLRNPKMSPAEQATDARDREKMAFEREKFDAEVKKGQWQKLTDGRLYNQTTGDFRDAPPPMPGSVTPKFDDISGMRKEIQQLPSYKNLAAAAPIYKAMAETAGRDSKASDLNLVYGLGKIMDPTSVVREGEMIMVKNTASLPDWLQGAIASLNGGAALTPETRQAIMTEAYGRVKGYNDEFQQNMGQYQGIVQRNGINPADVIPEIDKFEPWTAPEGAPAPASSIGTDWQEISPGVRIRKKAQ